LRAKGSSFLFGNRKEDDEVMPIVREGVVLTLKDTAYGYRERMQPLIVQTPACEQGSGVHLNDLWG